MTPIRMADVSGIMKTVTSYLMMTNQAVTGNLHARLKKTRLGFSYESYFTTLLLFSAAGKEKP